MNALALPLAGMLLAMLGELWLLARQQRLAPSGGSGTDPWLEAIANLNSGHLVLWLFRGVEVAGYAWIWRHTQPHALADLPPWLVGVIAFIAWDLGFYWLHRLHHRFGALWAIHAVHHQGEHFNLSLGIRNSWLSSLSSLPFFVPLALAGVPVEVFVAVSSIHYTVQFYNHCGVVGPAGWLEKVMVTPQHHRIHHGANPEYIDKNFGGTLLIWDKLFGTFQRPVEGITLRYGIDGWQPAYNPLWLNLRPLLEWLGLRVPATAPLPPLPARQRRWLIAGAVLLFTNVVYAVHRQGQWPEGQQPLLWALLALQTLALGAWAEGRPRARAAVVALGLAVPLLFIGGFGLRDPLGLLPMGALGLHAMVLTLGLRDRARSPSDPQPAGTTSP